MNHALEAQCEVREEKDGLFVLVWKLQADGDPSSVKTVYAERNMKLLL